MLTKINPVSPLKPIKPNLSDMFTDPNWQIVDRWTMGIYPNHAFRNAVKCQLAIVAKRSMNGPDFAYSVESQRRLIAAEKKENAQGFVVLVDEEDDQPFMYINHDTAGDVAKRINDIPPRHGRKGLGDFWYLDENLYPVFTAFAAPF